MDERRTSVARKPGRIAGDIVISHFSYFTQERALRRHMPGILPRARQAARSGGSLPIGQGFLGLGERRLYRDEIGLHAGQELLP